MLNVVSPVGDWGVIVVYLLVGVILSVVLILASYLLSANKLGKAGDSVSEKLSAYECGLDAFEDARDKFDVRFFLVGILFIMFDLEASYLFPWALTLDEVGSLGYWTMIDFLVELGIGFLYAWRVGAIEQMNI